MLVDNLFSIKKRGLVFKIVLENQKRLISDTEFLKIERRVKRDDEGSVEVVLLKSRF
jgi:hypothetical protein